MLLCVVIEILTHQTSWKVKKVAFIQCRLYNYIITICKLGAVWRCFLRESSLKSQSGGLTVAVTFFKHKHLMS